MGLNDMIKRRKDEGFTMIELMIVIAVIGILAVVLVPRMGAIKDTAKSAGVDVNVRTVAANVQARIVSWDANGTTPTAIQAELSATFNATGNTLTNPINGGDTVFPTGVEVAAATDALRIYTASPAAVPGGVVVLIPADIDDGIIITGYDANGSVTTVVEIEP